MAYYIKATYRPGRIRRILRQTVGRTLLAGCCAVALLPIRSTIAQDDVYVRKIVIEGNRRVEKETISSFLGIRSGRTLSSKEIDAALSSAYASGLFSDVSISTKGEVLKVRVKENPMVAEIVFEGNDNIEESSLRPELRLDVRDIYSLRKLQQDVQRLTNIYHRNGRFSANIDPQIEELSQNRIRLIYKIDEGDVARNARISFVGNEAFSSSDLRKEIKTKETNWFRRFLSGGDMYDPDRMEFDKELLRRFYTSKGYADFKAVSSTAELTPDRRDFFITYVLDEGKFYHFGKMTVESHLKGVESDGLDRLVESEQGEVFDQRDIDSTIDEMTRHLGNLGYAFVQIEPIFHRRKESLAREDGKERGIWDKLRDGAADERDVIDIHYLIKEGPRVYIDDINIHGNLRTLDSVIRREFRLSEGDPYNADQLKRSRERIQNLGYFGKVEMRNNPGSAKDRVGVDVEVEEKSTGELSFGAGYSTSDGALGNVGLTERNLLGSGKYLKLNFTVASVRQEVEFSFTEPYFMGRNFSAGFDIFNSKDDGNSSHSNRSYDSDRVGGVLRGSYPITEHLRHHLSYSYTDEKISDIDSNASLYVQRQAGNNITSMIGHTLAYDTRDNRFSPTEGMLLALKQEFAGIDGDSKFHRHELSAAFYYPIYERDYVLKLAGKAGYMDGYDGESIRINHRFFMGGRMVRGFDNDGIGPRDQATHDALGGKKYGSATAELMFPLGLPKELGFKGSIFHDAGFLYDTDDKTSGSNVVLDESSLRASVGAGISWSSPMGPIRINFAHAYKKEDYDDKESFSFSFGTNF